MADANTWDLVDRETGSVVKSFDVSDMWDSQRARLHDGLVYQVDFARYWLDKGEVDHLDGLGKA